MKMQERCKFYELRKLAAEIANHAPRKYDKNLLKDLKKMLEEDIICSCNGCKKNGV
jgi:hypothetical protein